MKYKIQLKFFAAIIFLLFTFPYVSFCQQEELTPEQIRTMSRAERIKRHKAMVQRMVNEKNQTPEQKQEQQKAERQLKGENQPGNPPSQPVVEQQAGVEAANYVSMLTGILHFAPVDQSVDLGQQFYTPLMISSTTDIMFDQISLRIKYSPIYLKPIKVYDNNLRPYVNGMPVFAANSEEGIITYDASLSIPQKFTVDPIITILWEAIYETESTTIDFQIKDSASKILFKSQDQLGDKAIDDDGFIRSNIKISNPDSEQDDLFLITKKDFTGMPEIDEENIGDIKLSLEFGAKSVKQNSEIIVYVKMDNPNKSAADNISLFIKFDPKVLEVIDFDNDNYISQGININDGEFREKYPYDLLIKNVANNTRGEIDYHMGFLTPQVLESGTLAKIQFKALTPTLTTQIYFGFDELTKYPNTVITLRGIDVLGSSSDSKDSTKGIFLLVGENPSEETDLAKKKVVN